MKLERKVIRVEGKDRARLLNDLLTITVENDMPMQYGALLSPQGKIFADLFLWSDANAHFLDVHTAVFDGFRQKLSMYKLRSDIEVFEEPCEVFQNEGEGDPRGQVGRRSYESDDGWSIEAYEKLRIEAQVPEFGVDFESNQAYPREWRFDEMRGINYKKGCFVGQEIAARMRHKSDLNKSVFKVSASEPLLRGQSVRSGEREIGEILTAQGNQALAFLRIKGSDLRELRVGDIALALDD